MLGVRDIVWSALICGALVLFFDCRPAWQARRFLEQHAEAGFLQAYAGHRWSGSDTIIKPKDAGGARDRTLARRVQKQRLDFKAQRMSWSGKRGEFVVRHVIHLEDGTPFGEDVSQDIHLRIEKRFGRWHYTLFEVRGAGAIDTTGNPFLEALVLETSAG
jgi:hypothetical protein